MRTVQELAGRVPGLRVVRGGDRPVEKVRIDSRRVGPGDLFVAIPGRKTDGMRFAGDAMARGACGVVAPRGAPPFDQGAWLVAEDVRLAAGHLASRAWGNPSKRLDVLGITGTDGKTTTTFLARSILEAAGRSTAIVGTLGVFLPDGRVNQSRTTPEAPDLQEALAAAADQGCAAAVVEVSSHALDLRRVDGTRFAAAAFLNLSAEHLDWHGSLESYGRSKTRLFSDLLAPGRGPNGPRAVLNVDDPWTPRLLEVVQEALLFTTGGGDAHVTARGLRYDREGSRFTLDTPAGSVDVGLRLPGVHNVENAAAAASVALVLGVGPEEIASGLSGAAGPPGRFERVHAGAFDAYVDYAHTPRGFRRALEVAREVASGRLIVVFGCGGERDPEKRPIMGKLATELADVAVFTSDNPRSEDPERIVAQMLEAVPARERERVTVLLDREEALAHAVALAGEGDVVLATGKGHETVQSVGGVDHPFPEREILARIARDRDPK